MASHSQLRIVEPPGAIVSTAARSKRRIMYGGNVEADNQSVQLALTSQFFPGFATLDVHYERDVQLRDILHQTSYRLGDGHFIFGHFEDQFVMNLKHHARSKFLTAKFVCNADHRDLDNVGSCALYRRINRTAFGHAAPHAVTRIDFRMLPDAPEYSVGYAQIPCLTQTIFDVLLNTLI